MTWLLARLTSTIRVNQTRQPTLPSQPQAGKEYNLRKCSTISFLDQVQFHSTLTCVHHGWNYTRYKNNYVRLYAYLQMDNWTYLFQEWTARMWVNSFHEYFVNSIMRFKSPHMLVLQAKISKSMIEMFDQQSPSESYLWYNFYLEKWVRLYTCTCLIQKSVHMTIHTKLLTALCLEH